MCLAIFLEKILHNLLLYFENAFQILCLYNDKNSSIQMIVIFPVNIIGYLEMICTIILEVTHNENIVSTYVINRYIVSCQSATQREMF